MPPPRSPLLSARRCTLDLAAHARPTPQGAAALAAAPLTARAAGETSLYDFTVQQYGKPFSLSAFRGKVTVVVNVASE